jgi:energy-coupling factor transporter ATP-binding protein EcfA2
LEIALSIDPKILAHFRLLEQPFRGGPDFRYLYTTDQVQEVLIRSVQLTVSRTSPFTVTGPYGTGKSTIITRIFSLLSPQEQFDVHLNYLAPGGYQKLADSSCLDTATVSPEELFLSQVWESAFGTTKTPLLVLADETT